MAWWTWLVLAWVALSAGAAWSIARGLRIAEERDRVRRGAPLPRRAAQTSAEPVDQRSSRSVPTAARLTVPASYPRQAGTPVV